MRKLLLALAFCLAPPLFAAENYIPYDPCHFPYRALLELSSAPSGDLHLTRGQAVRLVASKDKQVETVFLGRLLDREGGGNDLLFVEKDDPNTFHFVSLSQAELRYLDTHLDMRKSSPLMLPERQKGGTCQAHAFYNCVLQLRASGVGSPLAVRVETAALRKRLFDDLQQALSDAPQSLKEQLANLEELAKKDGMGIKVVNPGTAQGEKELIEHLEKGEHAFLGFSVRSEVMSQQRVDHDSPYPPGVRKDAFEVSLPGHYQHLESGHAVFAIGVFEFGPKGKKSILISDSGVGSRDGKGRFYFLPVEELGKPGRYFGAHLITRPAVVATKPLSSGFQEMLGPQGIEYFYGQESHFGNEAQVTYRTPNGEMISISGLVQENDYYLQIYDRSTGKKVEFTKPLVDSSGLPDPPPKIESIQSFVVKNNHASWFPAVKSPKELLRQARALKDPFVVIGIFIQKDGKSTSLDLSGRVSEVTLPGGDKVMQITETKVA